METVVGIPWYRPEDYLRLRKLFVDGDILHHTYRGWLKIVEKLEREMQESGMITVRAYIDPNTFPAWCLAKGKRLDTDGRIAFANEAAEKEIAKDEF